MVETIAATMAQHTLTFDELRRHSACKCGWSEQPMLTADHRAHVADQILAATMMATAQINGENIVAAREYAYQDAAARTHAVGLLLAHSGDITPMGTRMLDKIWEPAEELH